MRTIVNEPVQVLLGIDSTNQSLTLHKVRWQNRTYSIHEVGIIYSIRNGRKKLHVFCVNVGALDMRIHIDGDTLQAQLIETSDGLAD